jgi:hypothetical protein
MQQMRGIALPQLSLDFTPHISTSRDGTENDVSM